MHLGQIPSGVTDLQVSEVPVAVGNLEAMCFDHDRAIAQPLGSSLGPGEGQPQGGTVRARPEYLGAGEEACERSLTGLRVDGAVIPIVRPGVYQARGDHKQAVDCYRKALVFI